MKASSGFDARSPASPTRTLLVASAMFLPDLAVPVWMAVSNHPAAAATIWLAAMFVRHMARSRITESEQLRCAVRNACSDREGISQWLREDVDLELQMMEWRLNRLQRCAESPDLRSESFILRRAVARVPDAIGAVWRTFAQSDNERSDPR